MAKAVLFDFRGTLVDVSEARQASNYEVYTFLRSRKAEVTPEAFSHFFEKTRAYIKEKFARNQKIHNWNLLIASSLLSLFKVSVTGIELEELARKCDAAFVEKSQLYPDAKTILDFFKTRNVKMGVVIDGTSERERALLARLGLADFFDVVAISQEVGSNKFSLFPLRVALTTLGLPPNEVIVVGDRIDKDISPANELGCVSVFLQRGMQKPEALQRAEKPRYLISKLTELANFVD